jgi:hypothetical protein
MRTPGSLVRRVQELHPMVADGLLAALVTVLGPPGLFTADEALAKLDLRDRVQAVVLAYETGIVRPGAV